MTDKFCHRIRILKFYPQTLLIIVVLFGQFWRMWRAKLEQQKLARDNQSAAETLYRGSLLKQSWRSIVMYVNLRKAKYVQYGELSIS